MSPESSTENYPAFGHIGLRENSGKNLNQVTCPDRESSPGHLVSRPDALTSKASCLGLALRNARWFESSWEKKRCHEISVSVWDQCPPSIVMHLGRSCTRNGKSSNVKKDFEHPGGQRLQSLPRTRRLDDKNGKTLHSLHKHGISKRLGLQTST
ncbi:hypothetical protein ANN_17469 [Periplaneta americana]|uniref:Uncharacterized protein n=1 Tax=Periplaneta americana TaxID=6978 RepID=A0ABQ8SU88_PERAM|nr:hypothetical protein ANN_17469 [Periplaneta americana]